MRRFAIAALAVGLLVLSGCSSSPQTGSVTGVFETAGGAPGYGPHPLPGTVVFNSPQGTHASVRVGADGTFSATLPVGTYTAVGHSPRVISSGREMTCDALKAVIVSATKTERIVVDCQLM